MTTEFGWIRHSPFPAPEWESFRFHSLQDMLFSGEAETEGRSPVLVGVIDDKAVVVTVSDLRFAVAEAAEWRAERRLSAGSRVVIVRVPYASELVVAVNAIALMAIGVSVILPMQCDPDSLTDLIERTDCQFVLAPIEEEVVRRHPSASQAITAIRIVCKQRKIAECAAPVRIPLRHSGRQMEPAFTEERDVDAEVLILTTSASTGPAKLVRYSERALLTVAESWRIAGLLDDSTTGGGSLCPLLSHSMGVRNVLHAVWTRKPTLLIPPEWLSEAPHRAVRLLQEWPPRHFTGGPALIQALAQLANSIPEARRALRSLAVVVSSGSAWHAGTGDAFSSARVANAFGMTETQQVLSTLIPRNVAHGQSEVRPNGCGTLGQPLPGVSVAVRFTDRETSTGRLFVKSTFRAMGYVGEADFPEWFDTGDCVRVCNDELIYAGRDHDDFLSLGSGLKLSIAAVRSRYRLLAEQFSGLILRHSAGRMGIVALVFSGDMDPGSAVLHERVRSMIGSLHEGLRSETDEFELRHALIVAIGFVRGFPPRTGPGKIDQGRVVREQSDLLEALDNTTGRHPHMIEIGSLVLGEDAWYQNLMPYAGQLMRALNLDLAWVGGDGDMLFHMVAGERRAVVDLVGGFGANLLGHGRSDLQSVAISAVQELPMLDQVSRRLSAAELARRLSDRFGKETDRRYVCLFHSTGAEAVETALKHALFKWEAAFSEFNDQIRWDYGATSPEIVQDCLEHNRRRFASFRPLLIALQGGYHGKTSGALNVMSDDSQRLPFSGLLGARVLFVRRDELTSSHCLIETLCANEVLSLRRPGLCNGQVEVVEHAFSGVMAAIVEPIQGEGGIFEVPLDWLAAIGRAKVPLILDEIQCGLGRSGQFLASAGIVGDYYLIGKSLGGGIGKISVTLIDRAVYCDKFDLQTGATFSADAFSCRIALRVLDLLDQDDIPRRAARLGVTLKHKIESVWQAFPEVVRRVTGRGAMLGIELGLPQGAQGFLRELLSERLGYFASSYLLHRHNVRILPTMSAPGVLRVEPSACLTIDAMDQLVHGLLDFCQRIVSSDIAGLVQHLIPDSSLPMAAASRPSAGAASAGAASAGAQTLRRLDFRFTHEPPAPGASRVGFVFNPIYPADELLAAMPELTGLAIDQRIELVWRIQVLLELRPMELFSRNLFGNRVWLSGIMLPVSPETLAHWNRTGNLRLVRQRLDEALELAVRQGCRTVVFGASTSVVTANAASLLPPPGIQVSSGNSFTVAVMLAQIEKARKELGISRDARLAVVGASGNIGSAIVRWFVRHDRWQGPILIVGRPGSQSRLSALRDELEAGSAAGQILISENKDDLQSCDLIIVAVSGDGVVLHSHHVNSSRTVLIADVSQPRAVSASLAVDRPNAKIVWAGTVRLPDDPSFRLTPHTPRGTCFACTAEAILMGLEPHPLTLRGQIDPRAVETLQRLGEKYGLIEIGYAEELLTDR